MMQVFDYKKSKINVLYQKCRKLGSDISLPSPDSKMQFNVKGIAPHTSYRVTITAASVSRNSKILCNFFGGPRFDFAHHQITVDSREPKEFTVNMSLAELPPRVPISFRIWKLPEVRGNLVIKNIKIHQLKRSMM